MADDTPASVKAVATYHLEEDPDIVRFLAEVTGDARAMRIRRVMREGMKVVNGGALVLAASRTAAAPPAPLQDDEAAGGLGILGLNPADFRMGDAGAR